MRMTVLEPKGFTAFFKEKLNAYDLTFRFMREDGVWSKPVVVKAVHWKDLFNFEIESEALPFKAHIKKIQVLGPALTPEDDKFFEVQPGNRVALFEMEYSVWFHGGESFHLLGNLTLPVWT